MLHTEKQAFQWAALQILYEILCMHVTRLNRQITCIDFGTLRAGFIYIYIHAVCMFHVTCMDLGLFPCVLHTCYMHAKSSIIDCFPKVLKL